MMDTIEQMSRFLVNLGYSREEVVPLLEAEFPGEDAAVAYAEAVTHREAQKANLEATLDAQDSKAVEAEHDLDATMHGGWARDA